MKSNVFFCGFYESELYHSDMVWDSLNNYGLHKSAIILNYIDNNIDNYHEEYKNDCMRIVFNKIEDDLKYFLKNNGINQDLKLKLNGLHSPAYYNFETDRLIVEHEAIEKQYIDKLIQDKDIKEYIKNKTSSASGYIAYHSYNHVINDRELFTSFLLDFIGQSVDYWFLDLPYYDAISPLLNIEGFVENCNIYDIESIENLITKL